MVQYYEQNKATRWTLGETQYSIIDKDVIKIIDPPDLQFAGRRFYYKFSDALFSKSQK